jgi:CRISPR-associated endonuclease/helicase Cas3
MYFAHTPSQYNPDLWHSFLDHSKTVAQECSYLAEKIGCPKTGLTLGYLHDLGKLKPEFQNKLDLAYNKNIDTSVPHKEVGAYALKNHLGGYLSLVILGHHNQIPSKRHIVDHYEKTNQQETNICFDTLKSLNPSFEIDVDDFDIQSCKTPIQLYTRLKILHSMLVECDHRDTSNFYSKYKHISSKSTNFENLESNLNFYLRKKFFSSLFAEQESLPSNEINSQRAQLYRDCLKAAETKDNFYVLPAPTGAGKTLSSLAFSLRKAYLFNKQRIIFALPYTSIIEQTANIYKDIFPADKNIVLEHHSAVVDDENDKVFWRKKTSENWNCPIVVTTIVQLFESIFSNKPSKNKKLHNIVNSIIVLDEAQMLPLIYIKPIMEMLKVFAYKYNCTIVICTATPPSLNNQKSWSLDEKPYCIVENVDKMFSVFKRVSFNYEREKTSLDSLIDRIKNEDSILCIVNKRKTAQNIVSKLNKDNVYHLSTTMHPLHRTKTVEIIKDRLSNNLPVTLIATSCVECGVDFDFDKVYRELAPYPSIIQAAGRCNRNGKKSFGEVTIFQIEKESVKDPVLKTGIEITKMILDKNILDLENIINSETYFSELHKIYDADLDKKEILRDIKYLDFEAVDRKFKIIEQDTISIVISCPESQVIIDSINKDKTTGVNINRKLSPYTISLYDTDVQNFTVDTNLIPGVNIWTGNYSSLYGIRLDIDK